MAFWTLTWLRPTPPRPEITGRSIKCIYDAHFGPQTVAAFKLQELPDLPYSESTAYEEYSYGSTI